MITQNFEGEVSAPRTQNSPVLPPCGSYRAAEFITASRNCKYLYGLSGPSKNQLIEIINF